MADMTGNVRFLRALAIFAALTMTAAATAQYADDVFYDDWVYARLSALKEPDLRYPAPSNAGEVYRMLGDSYGTFLTIVRVNVWPNGGATGTVRVLDYNHKGEGFIGYERGFTVPPQELRNLRKALSDTGFWKLPVYEGTYEESGKLLGVPVCADGTYTLIEAQVGSRYRGVERSNCILKQFEQTLPIAEILKRIARPYVPADRHQFVHEKTVP
jgi:hypothetical protein